MLEEQFPLPLRERVRMRGKSYSWFGNLRATPLPRPLSGTMRSMVRGEGRENANVRKPRNFI